MKETALTLFHAPLFLFVEKEFGSNSTELALKICRIHYYVDLIDY
jgi:hypothetical protein